jgi:hypothetical protein
MDRSTVSFPPSREIALFVSAISRACLRRARSSMPPAIFNPLECFPWASLTPATFSRLRGLLCGCGARSRRTPTRGAFGVSRERSPRCRSPALSLECATYCTRPPSRGFFRSAPFCEIALRLALGSRLATLGWRQFYTRPPCFREANGYGLLRRPCSMFAFPYVLHFFAHEFARLGGRRQTFSFIFARPFDWLFFWHSTIVSPLPRHLDVSKIMFAHRHPPSL